MDFWKQLNVGARARLIGSMVLGLGLVALALALSQLVAELGAWRVSAPALLTQVDQTSGRLTPLLDEVAAVRTEVAAVRSLMPSVLHEAAALRQAAGPMIQSGAAHEMSGAVRAVEPHIPHVLDEVRKTRESLPAILDRAEVVVTRAERAGQDASQGAVRGFFGGIVLAPFRLLGDVGKSFADVVGLTPLLEFTEEDARLARLATDTAIRKGEAGAVESWSNRDSHNQGRVTVLGFEVRAGRRCTRLRYSVDYQSGRNDASNVLLCLGDDGAWSKPSD